MDPEGLDQELAGAFGGTPSERRVVVRQALDLAEAGRWSETHGDEPLTPERIVTELGQAPDVDGLADRWNWWIGSLEVAHGDFERFAVRRWRRSEGEGPPRE